MTIHVDQSTCTIEKKVQKSKPEPKPAHIVARLAGRHSTQCLHEIDGKQCAFERADEDSILCINHRNLEQWELREQGRKRRER